MTAIKIDIMSNDNNISNGNSSSEIDNLKRRHLTNINGSPYSKNAYHPIPLEPSEYDENGKFLKPIRLPQNKYLAFCFENYDILLPVFFTFLSFWTRFYLISLSNIVVWDEAHFGKFGSYYLKREFYFDVHPPLGKMLVGLAGLLAGYNGHFDFPSGEKYPDDVNYVFMRVFLASFDTAYACISRFILLDSMLLFFTFATTFCLVKFHNMRQEPFSIDWWLWLFLTGAFIGCVSSVKWVGLFVTALVGIYTIEDLWDKFGDLTMPKMIYLKHWIARIVCLIILPILIYMGCFAIHFAILHNSGPGDAQMSSLFQAGLRGNDFSNNPLELAYGSKITIKNMGYGGGLLHSHVQTYPTGSEQQQVTCYHYKDVNNDWIVNKPRDNLTINNETEIEFVKNNDVVRLLHVNTGRNLHSHPVNAPITKSQYEVSGYGNDTIGDKNDYWNIEVVGDILYGKTDDKIRSLTTAFRFKHHTLGCYLRAANSILPQWGFKQVEVTCDKRNNPRDVHTHWNIEKHWNDKLPPGKQAVYKSKFLHDFWHLNVAMYTTNNALVPDPDKEDILASTPRQWPIVEVGLRMCSWADDAVKYYLLGNPIVWWSGTASLIIFVFLFAWYIIRAQRKYSDFSSAQWAHFLYVGKLCCIGWFLHYIPFCIMGRVTYLHHYFPALYFKILLVGFLFDHFTSSLKPKTKAIVFGIMYLLVVGVFLWFKDIVFGMDYPSRDYHGRKWLSTWNIVD
ncbi:938_t:CDS:10 [Entrophospora sp. SA101]|nr:938_t:CDS:10 [Entrophospora sp. SA101]CAJ0843293.1 7057_t:CDS:10 [Entrophospora sp. SA101]